MTPLISTQIVSILISPYVYASFIPPSDQTKVGLAGGCEQLVKSLHVHRNHESLMSQGLRVMMGVAMGHDSNLARLQAPVPVPASTNDDGASSSKSRTSGFEIVVGAMQLYPDNRFVHIYTADTSIISTYPPLL